MAHQYRLKIFHDPCKTVQPKPPTYLIYGPLLSSSILIFTIPPGINELLILPKILEVFSFRAQNEIWSQTLIRKYFCAPW